MSRKKSYVGVPAEAMWEAIPRKERVRLILTWNTPMTVDEITSYAYDGVSTITAQKRVRTMLSELRSQRLVDSPSRGLWTAAEAS
tara:strand:- start:1179 stop:1433 length:255 start_codon:yes stop_codon:yes gene_type:complete